MITGFHTIIYSDDAEATRAFFRDVLRWPSIDVGGGWLIFKTRPAELGVHPTMGGDGERWGTTPLHRSSLMCDDIEATVIDLRAQDIEISDMVEEDFGRTAMIAVPGAGRMMLYQAHHELAHRLDD